MKDQVSQGGHRGSDLVPPVECLAEQALVHSISRVFENWGACVRIGSDRENLCRRARSEELAALPESRWVVESQGLPNLVHEFVHALFLGHLDDDHGFDYGLIPLDLTERSHRRHLWEELVCCAVSTAYAQAYDPEPRRFVADWFTEQVEIQGVFHGLEDDLDGYRARISEAIARPAWRAELDAATEQGYAAVAAALVGVGVDPAQAGATRLHPAELWANYRAGWPEAGPSDWKKAVR